MDVEHHKSGHLTRPTMDIPPRKLLFSPKSPNNYCYDSDSDDPYSGDHFRMYEFKIRRCTRSRSHDWTECPFSHPGEKARRRDPRRYQYTDEVCPDFRNGGDCSRGDECGFSHGVFECWLHPSRYRTEACKDGKHCQRKVCFFAHSPRQLRILPPKHSNKNNMCCLFCNPHSPTSTLLNELNSSLGSLSLTEVLATSSYLSNQRIQPWLDVGDEELQLQFALSPSSTPTYLHGHIPPPSLFSNEFTPFKVASTVSVVAAEAGFEVGYNGDLDLGWVNDLLT